MKPTKHRRTFFWRGFIGAVPGIGASLLPIGACPACWPAYAGILSAIGLGFLLEETYLLTTTAVFLLVAVASLAYRASSRRGYGPFYCGALGSAIALAGKFALSLEPLLYLGLALLVAASLWNAWPQTTARSRAACDGQRPS